MGKIKKTDHFYLIDGSGYIFRAYYALPPLTRKSDGLPTGAVSGFCSMLFKLLEDSSQIKIYKNHHILQLYLTLLEKLSETKFIVIIKQIDLKHLMIWPHNSSTFENQY